MKRVYNFINSNMFSVVKGYYVLSCNEEETCFSASVVKLYVILWMIRMMYSIYWSKTRCNCIMSSVWEIITLILYLQIISFKRA